MPNQFNYRFRVPLSNCVNVPFSHLAKRKKFLIDLLRRSQQKQVLAAISESTQDDLIDSHYQIHYHKRSELSGKTSFAEAR